MSAYTRELRDAIFHARNARRSLERAQAKAPVEHRGRIDRVHREISEMMDWARGAARSAELRGGIRR